MSRSLRSRAGVLLTCALAAIAAAQAADVAHAPFGFGKPASETEIAGWDIDVLPGGKGLPPGRGSVEQGQVIYDEKCASCHGTFGESNSYLQLAGGVGSLASDQPVRTTGSKLNYAPTLWDYIRRAMPFNAPQTLQPDEVYALTAYVLNLNDIVPAGTVLDQDSLPKVRMPNRDGFTTAHGMMRVDGKPDTANVACMRNCVAVVGPRSQMPAYARGSHGDLAQQRREMGAIAGTPTIATAVAANPPAAASPLTDRGLALATRLGCTACHSVDRPLVGPSFRAVAARYAPGGAGNAGGTANARLLAKIKAGGAGTWGAVPMPPQAQVADPDARKVVEWILGGAQ
ncbi:MAG: c-type cytochrome [Casimicrobiaceae bacterium]